MRRLPFLLLWLWLAPPAAAQSLFILQGERAVEASAGWSVGPVSNGLETFASVALAGRWDVGAGFNWYSADFGGPANTTFSEWMSFIRYLAFKEQDDGTPVTLSAHAQFVQGWDDNDDSGWYVLAGGQLYKKLALADGLALYPYVGFSLAGESYTFAGDASEHAVYLTRQFGVHGQITVSPNVWLRLTAEEHSFRRETYRAVRAAVVVRR